MDLDALRTFVAVMRRGSFAAVARDRDVAPSSVSRAIASLEEELGLRLFQRTTRRLSPTEAGVLYFERIEPIVDELDRARLMAADVGARPRGRLRVTAAVTFAQLNLVPLLPRFARAYPDLELDLVLTDATVDLVGERIDVALRLGQLADSALIARRLASMVSVVCASPEYIASRGRPASPGDLADHCCLLLPLTGYNTRWRFRRRAGGDAGQDARPAGDRAAAVQEVRIYGKCVISNVLAIGQCALAGMGVALLPRWVIGRELHDGTLVDLFPDHDVTASDFDTSVWLLYPSRDYLPLKVRVFVDFLQREFADGPPGESPGRGSIGFCFADDSR